MQLVVRGETFEVRERAQHPGHYDCDWVSGPNHGYGFSCTFATAHADIATASPDVSDSLERAIVDFLGGIDPDTGYLRD